MKDRTNKEYDKKRTGQTKDSTNEGQEKRSTGQTKDSTSAGYDKPSGCTEQEITKFLCNVSFDECENIFNKTFSCYCLIHDRLGLRILDLFNQDYSVN